MGSHREHPCVRTRCSPCPGSSLQTPLRSARTLDGMPSRPAIPLLCALVCVLALALTGVLAYLVPVAHVHDTASLQGFLVLHRPTIAPLASFVAHLADPRPYALAGLVLTAIAAMRRRFAVAAAIPLLLVATEVTTQSLKHVLAHPRVDEWLGASQIAAASWPSGHATAAMTLALCAVMAAPAALRPLAAFAGGAFAIAVAYAILVLGWHLPSDVLGGYLVAGAWTCAAVAALSWLARRRPRQRRSTEAGMPPIPAGVLAMP